jgi:hypothetical protein
MWYYYLAVGLAAFWWFLLRPRTGGKNSPPLVTSSSVVPIPLVGVIGEFLKNPNEMMKRCYKDYGQVFTIPVSPKNDVNVDCTLKTRMMMIKLNSFLLSTTIVL